ncbi:MAG TPA: hypothetical protein VMF31_01975 [Solirubrobacterales bacterium]|nr:hypothetical protein [Solirubrobacterales bacterium]
MSISADIRNRTTRSLLVLLGFAAFLLPLTGPAKAAEPDPFYGVISQSHMSNDEFDTMKWGRLGSFRLPVDWGTVDNGRGEYDWGALDHAVEATARRDIELLPVLYNTPAWLAGDRRRVPIWSSYAITKWRTFLRALVLRYGSDGTFWSDNPDIPVKPVTKWQIWNEPNIRYFAYPVSPKRYAKLQRISAAAIRGADPEAKIVTAGFYANVPDGKGMDAGPYMKRLYKIRSFRSSFDIAAIHPYARTTRESIQRTYPIRRVMDRNGNRNRRLAVTELGWGSDSATVFGMGDRQKQATQLTSAYRGFLNHRKRLKLSSVYWFSWSDLPVGAKTCAFCLETGLFDNAGEAKPAWFRLLDFTHDL